MKLNQDNYYSVEANQQFFSVSQYKDFMKCEATSYLPVVFPRVVFDIPADAATTRGESIDWQTKEITGTITRSAQVDDKYNHPWKVSPEEGMATEDDAVKYILAVFGSKNTTVQKQVEKEGKAVK